MTVNLSWLKKLRPDGFLVAIVAAAVIASLLPARGDAIRVFDWATTGLIAVLFFLYGARLEPKEALAGLKHWRMHLLILAFTYVVFPLVGLLIGVLSPGLIPQNLYLGILYLTLVPSTVQSSINFTSIAKGNVAGAVVSASASNLLGVLFTPLLVLALMGGDGLHIQASSMLDILVQILLPFVIGQLSRRWTAGFVTKHKKLLKKVDQGTIVLVVYNAFSAGMREGIWQQVSAGSLSIVIVVCLVILAFMVWLSWTVAGKLKFTRADQIAIMMCGTKKSLASGLPMASVLFASSAIPVGLIVLPLMIFHQAQLMACGAIAGRLARTAPEPDPVPAD